MTDGFNPGAPLGAVTAIKIVGTDSIILDIAAALTGAVAGGMAWDVLSDLWEDREKRRCQQSKYKFSTI
jgi:hypothetical protein